MNRREFLRRSSIVAVGVIAADQIDLVERLGWRRRLFPSADVRGRALLRASINGAPVRDIQVALQPDGSVLHSPDVWHHVVGVTKNGVFYPFRPLEVMAGDSLKISFD